MKNPFKLFTNLFTPKTYPEEASVIEVTTNNSIEVRTDESSDRNDTSNLPLLDHRPVDIDALLNLMFDDPEQATRQIQTLKSPNLTTIDATTVGIILNHLLRAQQGEIARNFINELDVNLFTTQEDHFIILRLISDEQNSSLPSDSILVLQTLLEKNFNAGSYSENAEADVFKIFSQQCHNSDHDPLNKELLKMLIKTGKIVGYESPDPANLGALSDLAYKIIEGIDNDSIVLHSIAEISNRATPQYKGLGDTDQTTVEIPLFQTDEIEESERKSDTTINIKFSQSFDSQPLTTGIETGTPPTQRILNRKVHPESLLVKSFVNKGNQTLS